MHQDPVTKSQRVTDDLGNVISTVDLDPWGGETWRSSNQTFQPHRYSTYERDSNGGDEAMMRRYQSYWNRFSQPDPYDGSYNLSDPQSFNRYTYAQNDPVNFIDPSGLDIIHIHIEWWCDNEFCFMTVQWWTDFQPYGGGPGGGEPGGGGPAGPASGPQGTGQNQDKKKCKQDPNRAQDPNGGDIPEIKDYLTRAGLLDLANPSASLIDPDSIKPSKEGITYTIRDVDQFNYALIYSGYAANLNVGFPWRGQHDEQVGGKGVDNRFKNGTQPDRLGRKSLQVVVGPPDGGRTATGYSDLDCSNPKQNPIKHILGK